MQNSNSAANTETPHKHLIFIKDEKKRKRGEELPKTLKRHLFEYTIKIFNFVCCMLHCYLAEQF